MPRRRKDCFFGIHFDFHARPGETVAYCFDPDSFREMLDRVKPDFMQFDTKGHAGLSSYPTAIGTKADGIDRDVLRFLREETEQRGISLYGHHSGLFDKKAVELHPEWAVIGADGAVNQNYVSPFSPYADQLLIPQLKELALDYRLDGAWIDGECWGCYVDYSPWAQKAYGRTPPLPGEEGYEEYREFCRQGFFDYITRYVEAVKRVAPDFEITSNWLYSPYMSHARTVPVDFLSGDFDCSNALISGRRNGRFFAARGIPWDLMSWGQTALPLSWETANRTTKSAEQLMQEAAMILSLGGGYQFFNIAYCSGGYLQRWAIPSWERIASFCRERQICHGAIPWSNLAVVVPYGQNAPERTVLFQQHTPGMDAYYAWIDALCESGFSPNVILESELAKTDLTPYDLLILPFPAELPETYEGTVIADGSGERNLVWLSDGERLSAMETEITKTGTGTPFGEFWTNNYFEHDSLPYPSAYRQGNSYHLAFRFAEAYEKNPSSLLRNWLKQLIADTKIPLPVKVSGSSFVEVVTTRKGDDLLVSLINTNGDHRRREVRYFDEIPPLYHLTVQVGDEIRTVEKLEIHELLVFQNYFK